MTINLELIDVYRAFQKNPATLDYFPDGLHPDPRGHRLLRLALPMIGGLPTEARIHGDKRQPTAHSLRKHQYMNLRDPGSLTAVVRQCREVQRCGSRQTGSSARLGAGRCSTGYSTGRRPGAEVAPKPPSETRP
jgi:hypothetical protein